MRLFSDWLFLLFWYILKLKWTNAEVYTAIVDLENLLKTEFILMETLQNYIQQQERKLDLLKKYFLHCISRIIFSPRDTKFHSKILCNFLFTLQTSGYLFDRI